MSRVLTFSRYFPSYHPRKGEPTYFVEKIWKCTGAVYEYARNLDEELSRFLDTDLKFNPKGHTIRAGYRWKVGDKFSPRIWSDKPYRSKQIIIAPDIEIKKVWDVEISAFTHGYTHITIPSKDKNLRTHGYRSMIPLGDVAANDGLEIKDFEAWFNPAKIDTLFEGQIICWNENIKY